MIRIATFNNYELMPECIKALFIETLFPMDRVAVLDDKSNFVYILDSLCSEPPKGILENANWNARHRNDGTIVKSAIEDGYGRNIITYGPVFREWSIKIREVDETRPWTIIVNEEYDEEEETVISTSEYIKYLDYEVINKTINYCKARIE